MYFLPLPPCCLTRSADQFLVSGTKYDIGRLVVIWARDLNQFPCFTFPSAQRTVERFVNHHIFATIQALQSQKYLRSFQNPLCSRTQRAKESLSLISNSKFWSKIPIFFFENQNIIFATFSLGISSNPKKTQQVFPFGRQPPKLVLIDWKGLSVRQFSKKISLENIYPIQKI